MANYLLKRGKLWWVQRKFPVDVKSELGTFFRKSLGTADVEEAKQRLPGRLAEFDMLVQEVRQTRDAGDLFEAADDQLSLAQMMAKYQSQVLDVLSNAAKLRHLRVLEGYGQFVGLDLSSQRAGTTNQGHGRPMVVAEIRSHRLRSSSPKRLNCLFRLGDWFGLSAASQSVCRLSYQAGEIGDRCAPSLD